MELALFLLELRFFRSRNRPSPNNTERRLLADLAHGARDEVAERPAAEGRPDMRVQGMTSEVLRDFEITHHYGTDYRVRHLPGYLRSVSDCFHYL